MGIGVVCVETGNYCGRGDRYVRNLKAMVKRHLTVPHNFYCITDKPKDGIECISGEKQLKGWWNKLYMFKSGLFDEELMLYFDLDTFIISNIDALTTYGGDFAMLRDFWAPYPASGVMLFRPDNCPVWDSYCDEGMPQTHPIGDGGWLGQNFKCDYLQDLYPGYFVSYKTECVNAKPKRASVVCFHGDPRPHMAKGWPRDMWNRMKPQETIRMLPANV